MLEFLDREFSRPIVTAENIHEFPLPFVLQGQAGRPHAFEGPPESGIGLPRKPQQKRNRIVAGQNGREAQKQFERDGGRPFLYCVENGAVFQIEWSPSTLRP